MRYKRVLANVLICSAALAADVPTSTLDASRNPLCGEFSLVLAASLMGRDVDFSAVRSAVRSGEFGASLAMLASGASAIGLSSSAIAFTPDALETAGDRPLIVWLSQFNLCTHCESRFIPNSPKFIPQPCVFVQPQTQGEYLK